MANKQQVLKELQSRAQQGLLTDEQMAAFDELKSRGAFEQEKSALDVAKDVASFTFGPLAAVSPIPLPQQVKQLTSLSGALPIAGALTGGALTRSPGGAALGARIAPTIGATLGGLAGTSLEDIIKTFTGQQPPQTLGQQFGKLGTEAGIDVLSDALTGGAGRALTGISRGLKPLLKRVNLPQAFLEKIDITGATKGFRRSVQQEEKEAFKSAQRQAKQKFGEAKDAVFDLPFTTGAPAREEAGRNLQNVVSDISKSTTSEVRKVGPIIRKMSASKINIEPTRRKIVDLLKSQGLIDNKGNILRDEVNRIRDPKRKQFVNDLIGFSDDLQTSPTVSTMDRVVKDLQSFANFGAKERTATDKAFGSLSFEARQDLLKGIETVSSLDTKTFVGRVRNKFSNSKKAIELISDITSKPASQIIDSPKITGDKMLEAIKLEGRLKRPIQDVVINKFANALSSPNPKTFSKLLDKFGRDALPQILDTKTMKSLNEVEQNLIRAQNELNISPPDIIKKLPKFQQRIIDLGSKDGFDVQNFQKLRTTFQLINRTINGLLKGESK